MNITKRLYTYPVLSEERDDYTDSVFDADVQYKMNGVNNLLFDFGIEMDNKELQKMILEGDAEYVVHIECTNTSYRTTIHDISKSRKQRNFDWKNQRKNRNYRFNSDKKRC